MSERTRAFNRSAPHVSDNQTGRVAGAFTLPSNSDIAILFVGAFDHTIAGGGKADMLTHHA